MRGVPIRFSVLPCVSVALQVLVADDASKLLKKKMKKYQALRLFMRPRVDVFRSWKERKDKNPLQEGM